MFCSWNQEIDSWFKNHKPLVSTLPRKAEQPVRGMQLQ